MESFFRIVTSNQWEEAQITGIIPKCSRDEQKGVISVSQFSDLEYVCNKLFKADDYPLALEFAPDSYPDQLTWRRSKDKKVFRRGSLKVDYLAADLVLSIFGFEFQLTGKARHKLLGEN